jgi:hypothetical protein
MPAPLARHGSRPKQPPIVHTSLYLPEPVYEALREIAFKERLKIHDVVLEGIDLALRRLGIRRSKASGQVTIEVLTTEDLARLPDAG